MSITKQLTFKESSKLLSIFRKFNKLNIVMSVCIKYSSTISVWFDISMLSLQLFSFRKFIPNSDLWT